MHEPKVVSERVAEADERMFDCSATCQAPPTTHEFRVEPIDGGRRTRFVQTHVAAGLLGKLLGRWIVTPTGPSPTLHRGSTAPVRVTLRLGRNKVKRSRSDDPGSELLPSLREDSRRRVPNFRGATTTWSPSINGGARPARLTDSPKTEDRSVHKLLPCVRDATDVRAAPVYQLIVVPPHTRRGHPTVSLADYEWTDARDNMMLSVSETTTPLEPEAFARRLAEVELAAPIEDEPWHELAPGSSALPGPMGSSPASGDPHMHSRRSHLAYLLFALASIAACGDASTSDSSLPDPTAPTSDSAAETGSDASGSSGGESVDRGSETSTGETTGADEDSETSGDGATASDPAAPRIISILSNVSTLDPDTTLIISAVVTDPDGIADVIGGQLTTVNGAQAYGSFQTAGEEGAYEISLTWEAIDAVEPIDFLDVDGKLLELRAEFYDQSGNTAWDTVEVAIECVAACADACVLGECHPSIEGSCAAGSRCLWDSGAYACFHVETPGVLNEPCESNVECADEFWCYGVGSHPYPYCVPTFCDSSADCPELFTCEVGGGCGHLTYCDY